MKDRLSFLDTGIVDILTNATGGLGVVLEHRYYGKLCEHTLDHPVHSGNQVNQSLLKTSPLTPFGMFLDLDL